MEVFRMFRCVLIILCLTGTQASGMDAEPVTTLFRGASDASAAVALTEEIVVVADDETNVLRAYRIRDVGLPIWQRPLDAFLGSDPEHPEADIEAGARIGNRIYWISSHGRNKDGKIRSSRYRFFATTVRKQGDSLTLLPEGNAYRHLAHDLTQLTSAGPLGLVQSTRLHETLKGQQRSRLAPKKEGFNIEGLCASEDGSVLYIGFRNPRPLRRALVIPLLNPDAVVMRGVKPLFGKPLLWGLQGLGIRSMTYAQAHRAYFIVAGAHDAASGFHLYRWSGQRTELPKYVCAVGDTVDDFTPEALVAFEKSRRLWIASDDGSRRVRVNTAQDCLPDTSFANGMCENKHLKDPLRRTFRSLWLEP
jgi:hypothetical protein